MNEVLTKWHKIAETGDRALYDELFADDAVFYSPVVHTPQEGKEMTIRYLLGAFEVFKEANFQYVREIVAGNDAVLEFTAVIDGIKINGVDIISWNEAGQITEFKVMIRPLKAINMLHQKMREMLASMATQ